ncbi:hypothetical protein CDL15_Pgr015858 [Punica granatum]|uniref:Uncharacterized protein n=1 Tax=Punica granatum TaxID=22663 RepID=A0A218XRD5_PUNGR|nr:hypothetical protein CDL15_Pgr015858 [Punica granatum]PKI37156.1 hypothetical protein CRG98_042491 [Punica granatum]
MNLKDKLHKKPSVRKVNVLYVSKKYGRKYWLLHAITIGHSCYGNWAYEFNAGKHTLRADSWDGNGYTRFNALIHPCNMLLTLRDIFPSC